LGAVLFVLLVYWRRTGRVRPLLVGLAVAVVLFVLQATVVTSRERVGRTMDAIQHDLVAQRSNALAAALAPDFEAGGMNRDTFLEYVRRQMERVNVRDLDRTALRIERSEGDRLVVSVSYLASIVMQDYAGDVLSRWSLTFARTPAGWKIVSIQPLHVGGVDRPTWGTLEGH
jgi:hypothetical protein